MSWDALAADISGVSYTPPRWELPIVLMTWAGTGSDMWNTAPPQPAAVAQAAQSAFPDVFYWQPVGYPAAIYPMGASVNQGYFEGVRLATQVHPNNFIIPIGYSQGSICASNFWTDFILPHSQQDRIPCSLQWGNPRRCPGVANGNVYAGWGMPALRDGVVTGGIAGGADMLPSQVPPTWLDFVWLGNDGGASELYTAAPVGTDAGIDEELIYNMIVSLSFGGTLEGLIALIESAGQQFFKNPINFVIGLAESIWNGLRFLASGASADHYDYDITPMINYLTRVVAPQYV